jgi:hypothetical protein
MLNDVNQGDEITAAWQGCTVPASVAFLSRPGTFRIDAGRKPAGQAGSMPWGLVRMMCSCGLGAGLSVAVPLVAAAMLSGQ